MGQEVLRMWEADVSVGSLTVYMLWLAAFIMIGAGWAFDTAGLGQLGLALAGCAVSVTIVRDGQRTRRMLARPGEKVQPIRR